MCALHGCITFQWVLAHTIYVASGEKGEGRYVGQICIGSNLLQIILLMYSGNGHLNQKQRHINIPIQGAFQSNYE